MKRIFIALAVLALAGCASVSGLREKAPDATFTSGKDAAAITACISDGWLKHRSDVRVTPTTGGQTVMIYNSATYAPIAFADIKPSSNRVIVAFYRNSGPTSWAAEAVKQCI